MKVLLVEGNKDLFAVHLLGARQSGRIVENHQVCNQLA